MTVESLPTLCTQAEVERVLSVNGVLDFADHNDDGTRDTNVLEDCIQRASDELHMYLHDRYLPADLAACKLVNRWAAVGAAVYLCQTRNNPPPESLEKLWDQIIAPDTGLAATIGAGKAALPGVSLRYDSRPSWSNLQVDRRYPTSKTRVTQVNSSDVPTTLTQDERQEWGGFDL